MATILWSDSRIVYSLERALNNPFLLHIPDVSAEIARIWVFTTGTGIGEKWRGDEKYGEEDRTVEDDGESEVVGGVGTESFSSSSFITSSPLDRWRRYRSVWWWIVEMSNISPVTFFIISRNKKDIPEWTTHCSPLSFQSYLSRYNNALSVSMNQEKTRIIQYCVSF